MTPPVLNHIKSFCTGINNNTRILETKTKKGKYKKIIYIHINGKKQHVDVKGKKLKE